MKTSQIHASFLRASVAVAAVAVLGYVVPAQAQQVNMVRRSNQDYHTVTDGDTLYDLAGRYMGDVYEWPRLWSYNPHITNPHWIYPGDIVYLRPATQEGPKAEGPKRIVTNYSRVTELHMAVGGFVASEELKYVGRIVASPKQAVMLSEHDKVWVGFGEDAYTDQEKEEIDEEDREGMKDAGELRVGNNYAIVRKVGTMTDEEDNVLGHKYVVLGSLTLTELSEKYLHTAEIAQSWREIQRGDLLVPYEQQLKITQIIQADRNLVAEVVDTLEPRSNLGEFHYVFVNKGADDGVRMGNRFYVFQKREGLQRDSQVADDKIPWMRIGQILLIDVRKNYSTGLVIDSSREIFEGDRLEMYEGY